MKRLICFLLFTLVVGFKLYPQKTLQILCNKLGNYKKFEVFTGETLEYKLIGDRKYKKGIIVNLVDSLVVFKNESVIHLQQIKAIRLHKNIFLLKELQAKLKSAGVLFFAISTTNNILLNHDPIVTQKNSIISLSILAAGFLVNEFEIKRIKIGKKNSLKILDINYQDLKSK